MCEVFNALPYMGGLFDQPYYVLSRMESIKLAENTVEEAEEKKATARAEADQKVAERHGT